MPSRTVLLDPYVLSILYITKRPRIQTNKNEAKLVKFLDGINFFVAVIADNIKYEQYMTGTAAKYTSKKKLYSDSIRIACGIECSTASTSVCGRGFVIFKIVLQKYI